MKLNEILSDSFNAAEWEAKGYELPKYDIAAVAKKTHNEPTWVHFGAGNIFRAFPAAILNDALNTGKYDRGVIVAESFDYEIIDTVAASEFYPIDTSAAHAKKMAKIAAIKNGKDSVGIYYVGSNSTKDLIELVSYPSRRDTMMYSKTRHIKVKGNADINHVVRVDFYLLNGKDSLVKYVEEVELKTNH